MQRYIEIIECPRDAMQGWHRHIPTQEKIGYIKSLLNVGFDALDAGSFVSPKAIPQMADTAQVFEAIQPAIKANKLLAIVANERGAEQAVNNASVHFVGFPFSISNTFQQLNTNSSIEESWERLKTIFNLCQQHQKELVVYISMAFGNPYGDDYDASLVYHWVEKMEALGVGIISLADTVGLSTPDEVYKITKHVIDHSKTATIGVHLHSTQALAYQKIEAAYKAGCNRFDCAIGGIGGCPMAQNDLVGNIDTNVLLQFLQENGAKTNIDHLAFENAQQLALQLFY